MTTASASWQIVRELTSEGWCVKLIHDANEGGFVAILSKGPVGIRVISPLDPEMAMMRAALRASLADEVLSEDVVEMFDTAYQAAETLGLQAEGESNVVH